MKIIAMKPNTELPQPYPRSLYNGGPARVNRAANNARRVTPAATAEAACRSYTSMKLVFCGKSCENHAESNDGCAD